jgi:hypothetical protein
VHAALWTQAGLSTPCRSRRGRAIEVAPRVSRAKVPASAITARMCERCPAFRSGVVAVPGAPAPPRLRGAPPEAHSRAETSPFMLRAARTSSCSHLVRSPPNEPGFGTTSVFRSAQGSSEQRAESRLRGTREASSRQCTHRPRWGSAVGQPRRIAPAGAREAELLAVTLTDPAEAAACFTSIGWDALRTGSAVSVSRPEWRQPGGGSRPSPRARRRCWDRRSAARARMPVLGAAGAAQHRARLLPKEPIGGSAEGRGPDGPRPSFAS